MHVSVLCHLQVLLGDYVEIMQLHQLLHLSSFPRPHSIRLDQSQRVLHSCKVLLLDVADSV